MLTELQAELAAALSADAYFIGPPAIPVLTENKGDIEFEINKAINEIGISVIAITPKAEPRVRGAQLSVSIGITENVVVNRATGGTQKAASAVVEKVWDLLNNKTLTSTSSRLLVDGLELIEARGLLVYEVRFKTEVIL